MGLADPTSPLAVMFINNSNNITPTTNTIRSVLGIIKKKHDQVGLLSIAFTVK